MYDSILSFFESIKSDNMLSQRIIGVLPNEIHQVYLSEREYACKCSLLSHFFLENHPKSSTATSSSKGRGIDNPQFFKEVLERGDD